MTKAHIIILFLTGALILAACSSPAAAASDSAEARIAACPTTAPDPETKLYGDENGLQVFISREGVWDQLPPGRDGGYGQKIFWKYPGYSWTEDQTPDLDITAEQLDGEGYFVQTEPATNAFAESLYGSAILTGVGFPQAGCWQITGEYRGATLTFVVWVSGQPDSQEK
jgi:hypothetical protein